MWWREVKVGLMNLKKKENEIGSINREGGSTFLNKNVAYSLKKIVAFT